MINLHNVIDRLIYPMIYKIVAPPLPDVILKCCLWVIASVIIFKYYDIYDNITLQCATMANEYFWYIFANTLPKSNLECKTYNMHTDIFCTYIHTTRLINTCNRVFISSGIVLNVNNLDMILYNLLAVCLCEI